MEEFGKAKIDWFRRFLDLPSVIPSHDTFGRVFSLLDSEKFMECFANWIADVADLTAGEVSPRLPPEEAEAESSSGLRRIV